MNDTTNEANSIGPQLEEGISPVSQARRPLLNVKAFASLATAAALIVVVASMVVARIHAQGREESAEKRSGELAGTASRAGAPPLKILANPAGMPPTAGGVQPSIAGEHLVALTDPSPQKGGAFDAAGNAGAAMASSGVHGAQRSADPLDAPVLLVPAPALSDNARFASAEPAEDAMAHARARLEETRAHLQQVLSGVAVTAGQPQALSVAGGAAPTAEQGIKRTSTARIGAARLVAPSLTLPRGASFGCALSSKIVSEQTGPVSCVVSRNVYGADGRVLLVERGSHLDGLYQAQMRVGASRISVVWERLRMPNNVVVDLASPSTGPLGEAGVGGFVDNHWMDRIGGALLLSFIDDAVKIEVAHEQAKGSASGTVLVQGSGSETSSLAGKVLDSTINIPPTIVKNQGEIVAVSVARDVDFSPVYELRPGAIADGH